MYTTPTTKPVIAVILGADRVGKSTLINKLKTQLENSHALDISSLHFSGPQPHHHTPIQQYTDPLDALLQDWTPQVILCDRGFSEVCFYDKFRRNIDTTEEWALASESYFASRACRIKVFLLKKEWETCKPFHLAEIKEQNPDSSLYYQNCALRSREVEHYSYYKYMDKYLKEVSLIPSVTAFNSDTASQSIYEFIMDSGV
jgi:hypothetical protein